MRLLLSSLISIMLFATCAQADNVLVIHQNYGGAHTNVGSRLTTEGHTVTYSTSTTLPSITGYDQIWDLRYQYGYSTTEVTTLNNFVKDGGFLMMNGENSGFATRNNSIASVVSATGGGTLTYVSGSNSYTVINSDFTNDTGTVTGASGSGLINSQGQYLFKTSSGVIGGMIWQSADLGSSYSGAIMVTADINMWDSTYGSTLLKVNITDDILDMETATTLYGSASATPVDPDKTTFTYYNTHNTRKDSFDDIQTGTENTIRMQQVGDNADIDIVQNKGAFSDRGNMIAGRTQTDDTAYILGDYNTVDLTQLGNNNVMNLDMDGDHNIMTGSQNGEGHRSRSIIEGNHNDLYWYQSNTGGEGNFVDHYIVGNSNSVATYQYDNNQLLVIDNVANSNDITAYQRNGENYGSMVIRNDGHTIGLDQKGGGDHAVDVNISGYSTTVTITQDSATSRSAEVHNNCTNAGGCTVTLNQQ